MVFDTLRSRRALDRAWAAVEAEDSGRLGKYLQLLSYDDKSALLFRAINSGNAKYVECLLHYDIPLEMKDKFGTLPLERAFENFFWECVTLLVAKGASVNREDKGRWILLHQIAYWMDEDTVRLAIEKGGDVKQKSWEGCTAMHRAAQNGHNCRLLAELGSPIDPIDDNGQTPLFWAARYSPSENVVRELASLSANFQHRDNQGNTALHLAAKYGNAKLISALAEVGVPVNATNNENRTALHVAVESKRRVVAHIPVALESPLDSQRSYEAVRELSILDADPEIKDKNGITALQLANINHFDDAAKLLNKMLQTKTGNTLSPALDQTGDGANIVVNALERDSARELKRSSSGSNLETSEDRQRRESKIWLERIQHSAVTFEQIARFTKLERIKIAVLDTGYDPESDFFRDRARKRLIKFEDWVDKGSTFARDEDGHGTHVLSLAMKVAPAARLFVCRIARGREAQDLRDASGNIAEAITRAAVDWGADIISLSFGYPKEVLVNGEPVISNAISRALAQRNQQLLIFAAASNGGPHDMEMFPANSPSVMSIRGSDAKGWLERFNALPDPDGIKSFMTLGQFVPGARLSPENDKGEVYKSGTSSATPIAAGIAAIILGYARVHEQELKERLGDDQHQLYKLWQISGMRAMFAAISSESFHRCLSLDPFKFMEESHQRRFHLVTGAVWKAIY
ncbi:ankyrin repeat-containing domain protein [Aspergillus recurvatus]